MAGYNRPEGGWSYHFNGMNTVDAPDQLDPTQYPVAVNVRAIGERYIQTRPGYQLFTRLLNITTTCPLPDGSMDVAYSLQLQASGGTGPYTWSIVSGALPSGLSLSSSGLVSGTPSAFGSSTFTIQVRDSLGAIKQKSCSMSITGNCDGFLLAQYASGGICPTSEKINLWADNFSGYVDNNPPGAPGWSDTGSYGVAGSSTNILTKQTVGGQPVLRATIGAGFGNKARQLIFIGTSPGYPNFGNTECGVYQECTYKARSGLVPSATENGLTLCIGLDVPGSGAPATNTYLVWLLLQGKLHLFNGESASTIFVSGMAVPSPNDLLRFQVYHLGAFTWKLEAFINDISVGSTTSSGILLTNGNPKRLGIGAHVSNALGNSGTEEIANWKAGVF